MNYHAVPGRTLVNDILGLCIHERLTLIFPFLTCWCVAWMSFSMKLYTVDGRFRTGQSAASDFCLFFFFFFFQCEPRSLLSTIIICISLAGLAELGASTIGAV